MTLYHCFLCPFNNIGMCSVIETRHAIVLHGCALLRSHACPPARLPPCVQARYVELLVQLRSQQRLRMEKAGLSLLGSQGVQLHAEGGNDAREKQLRKGCAKLEEKLSISLGAHMLQRLPTRLVMPAEGLASLHSCVFTACCLLCLDQPCQLVLHVTSACPSIYSPACF